MPIKTRYWVVFAASSVAVSLKSESDGWFDSAVVCNETTLNDRLSTRARVFLQRSYNHQTWSAADLAPLAQSRSAQEIPYADMQLRGDLLPSSDPDQLLQEVESLAFPELSKSGLHVDSMVPRRGAPKSMARSGLGQQSEAHDLALLEGMASARPSETREGMASVRASPPAQTQTHQAVAEDARAQAEKTTIYNDQKRRYLGKDELTAVGKAKVLAAAKPKAVGKAKVLAAQAVALRRIAAAKPKELEIITEEDPLNEESMSVTGKVALCCGAGLLVLGVLVSSYFCAENFGQNLVNPKSLSLETQKELWDKSLQAAQRMFGWWPTKKQARVVHVPKVGGPPDPMNTGTNISVPKNPWVNMMHSHLYANDVNLFLARRAQARGMAFFFLETVCAAIITVLIPIQGTFKSKFIDNVIKVVMMILACVGGITKAVVSVYTPQTKGDEEAQKAMELFELISELATFQGPFVLPDGVMQSGIPFKAFAINMNKYLGLCQSVKFGADSGDIDGFMDGELSDDDDDADKDTSAADARPQNTNRDTSAADARPQNTKTSSGGHSR